MINKKILRHASNTIICNTKLKINRFHMFNSHFPFVNYIFIRRFQGLNLLLECLPPWRNNLISFSISIIDTQHIHK